LDIVVPDTSLFLPRHLHLLHLLQKSAVSLPILAHQIESNPWIRSRPGGADELPLKSQLHVLIVALRCVRRNYAMLVHPGLSRPEAWRWEGNGRFDGGRCKGAKPGTERLLGVSSRELETRAPEVAA
jgi:hypothetical protein